MSNTSVACPGEAVMFTCSMAGFSMRWQVDPPAESGLMTVQSAIFLVLKLVEGTHLDLELSCLRLFL